MKKSVKAMLLVLGLLPVLLACQRAEQISPSETQHPLDTTLIPTSITPTITLTMIPTIITTVTATSVPSAIPFPTPANSYPQEWLAFVNRDFKGRTSHPNISILDTAETTISFIRQDGSGLIKSNLFEEFHSMIEYSLVWSSDGNYLLFDWSNFAQTMTRIPVHHLVDLPRKKITLVESNQAWVLPSWSPDGEWFVTSLLTPVTNPDGKEQNTYNLFRLDPRTFQKDRLTISTSSDLFPSWSPDGQWIAFLRYTPESLTPKPGSGNQCGSTPDSYSGCSHADLYKVNSEGGDPILLLESVYIHMDQDGRDSVYNNPAWSSDSKWLAVLTGSEQPDITLVNIESGGTQVLASHPALDIYPSWSPDGNKLVFVSNREGNEEIYLVSRDGDGLVNLTNDIGSDYSPVWSPSGRYIAFLSDREESRAYKLYAMSSDGTNQHKVYESYVFTRPAWFPLVGVDLQKIFGFGIE